MVLKNSRILIIEDSNTSISHLQNCLSDCELMIFKSGKEGLKAAFNFTPDLILLDLTLPDIDGLKLCKRFKEDEDLKNIPIIVLTTRDDIDIAFKLGADDYLKKPFSQQELLARIKVRVRHKQLRQERKEVEKALRESREWFSSIINTANEAIISINNKGKIILWNEGAVEIFGYSSKEAKASEFTLVIPEKFRISHKRKFKKVVNKKESININSVEVTGLKKDKTEVPIELSVSSLQIKDEIFFTCIIRDITKRKEKRHKLKKAYSELNESLDQAKNLHRYLLTNNLPDIKELSLATYYQPAKKLGGDFYNIEKAGDSLIFYLADVSGHGLDGALLNILVRENVKSFISELGIENKKTHSYDWLLNEEKFKILKPQEIMSHILEKYNQENFPQDYFLCLQVGILDLEEMKLEYSNAGFHIMPFIISNKREIFSLSVTGLPISSAIEKERFEFGEEIHELLPGEKIFFITDGLVEEMVNNEMYGEKRLKDILQKNYYLPPEIFIQRVKDDFKSFIEKEDNSDDITILALERKPEERFTKQISSDLNEICEIEKQLEEFLVSYVEDINELKIGFHELLVNAIEHGNNLNPEKEVSVEVCIENEFIRIIIEDEGDGFNYCQKIKQEIDYQNCDERGRGIILAQKTYDEIVYNEQGNKVCLIKFI